MNENASLMRQSSLFRFHSFIRISLDIQDFKFKFVEYVSFRSRFFPFEYDVELVHKAPLKIQNTLHLCILILFKISDFYLKAQHFIHKFCGSLNF